MATIPPKIPEKGQFSATPAGNAPAASNGSATPPAPLTPPALPPPLLEPANGAAPQGASIGKSTGPPPLTGAAVAAKAPAAGSQPAHSTPPARTAAPAASGPFTFSEAEQQGHPGRWLRAIPSWLASMIFHTIVILVMAVWINPVSEDKRVELTALTTEPTDLQELTNEDIQPLEVTALDTSEMEVPAEDVAVGPGQSIAETFSDQLAADTTIEMGVDGSFVESSVLASTISQGMGESLSGIRAGANREAAIRKFGGNADSEAAVAAALKWLATQQLSDGGWTFDLRKTPNPNPNPGEADRARAAATAMAILPFLGAGHTPKEGRYATVVRRGIQFLAKIGRPMNTRFGPAVSWHEPQGRMYSHGLASIAFCEAYAMTNDKALLPYAQASVNFISAAQLFDGGWRYEPPPDQRGGGDTSIVGWQIMALKSASMGYQLHVEPRTLIRAYEFLNKVQNDDGAAYGYVNRNDRPRDGATTAIGLLCRMYYGPSAGWDKENPALERGVYNLSRRGPSMGEKTDMYYNYYATQVMRHWEGEEWEKWNKVMRDYLIATQAKNGAETGSWYFDDPSDHGAQGQRLYVTSLATMTLEVYYRHFPLYQKTTTEAQFKP